jgi:hypothetical protein
MKLLHHRDPVGEHWGGGFIYREQCGKGVEERPGDGIFSLWGSDGELGYSVDWEF